MLKSVTSDKGRVTASVYKRNMQSCTYTFMHVTNEHYNETETGGGGGEGRGGRVAKILHYNLSLTLSKLQK